MNAAVGFIFALGLVLPIGLGLALGAYRAAQSPKVMAEAAALVFKAAAPILKEIVLKRNTPEVERLMHACIRRAGRWDNFRKRCMDR